uniref:NADH dehydrogenase subunit 4L n=1 Tax=Lychas mucronatus TaxID=172552 RepID=UPI0023D823C6|nr:NADH dehydrogenase subunit 4L [Lychas mucronatus]WDA95777.1 NADH dehydrogenase subunit 4L [Lychas mucronatus]
MMNYSISLGVLILIISFLSLCSRYKHILSMLLSMEMLILSVFILISSVISLKNTENSLLMIFLCLAVCEGSLGLAMLVSMSRKLGNTLINSTSIL